MKQSIRVKYTLILTGVFAAIILGLTLFVTFGMEPYVSKKKEASIIEAVDIIKEYIEEGWDAEEENELKRLSMRSNLGIGVYDLTGFRPVLRLSTGDIDTINERFYSFVTGRSFNVNEIIEQNDEYALYRIFDPGMNGTQIECLGSHEGSYYIISTSLAGIHESVQVTNRFLLYIGIAGLLIGAVLIYFVSRGLTKPIRNLADLSENITRLDFSGRYEGKQKDEIGVLGNNMNTMSENLEKTVSELTAANLQLEEDIRERERIDQARRDFISAVSHDLKTPIALIQGYSEGLKDGIADGDPENMDYYCDVIIDEADKMNQLVRRLLNLDAIESGRMTPTYERFDLVEMLRGLMQSSAMLVKGKNCQFKLVAPEKLYAEADEFLMEEAVGNYMSNACKYVSQDGMITVQASQEPDDMIKISVTNTGDPIDEEDMDRVFEKFYKADKARTRSYGGNGIGLSIVRSIVEMHGGQTGVENTDDGVMFWFTVRAHQS